MKRLVGVVVAGMVFALTSTAMAVPITVGSGAALSGTTLALRPELAGLVIVDDMIAITGIDNFGNVYYTGDIQVRIVRETVAGTLDFYFRIFNDASSTDAIERVTSTDFTGATIDVDYRTDGSGVAAPFSASHASGSTVSFNFTNPFTGTGGIAPGSSSLFFFIKTDATSYTRGSTVTQNGGQASVSSYAVPEPGTLLLLGSGLLGLGLMRRKQNA